MENISKPAANVIGPRDRAYYRRRQQNRIHTSVAKFFAEEAEAGRITKKAIAAKLEKDPAQITRWLSNPTNLEIDTISDILLAMGAEMDWQVVRFVERAKPNYLHPALLEKFPLAKKTTHDTVELNADGLVLSGGSATLKLKKSAGAF